jgi:hypothetical protein
MKEGSCRAGVLVLRTVGWPDQLMIRRVAFDKAVGAGAAGALAWELVVRALLLAGAPLFDLVRLLGTMVTGDGPPWVWWPVGLALHALVGATWAIFYAYFVWSTWDVRPAVQGLGFAVGPALLAGLVMIPQLGLMHELVLRGDWPDPGRFAWRLGWGGPTGIVLGHLVYGAVMGALYVRPVGQPVRTERSRA